MLWRCTNLSFTSFTLIHTLSLMTQILMNWITTHQQESIDELVCGFDCFIIKFFSFKFFINQCCLAIDFIKLLLRLDFLFIMVLVKWSCEEYAKALMDELRGRFLNYELMSTLNVIYLNFWDQNFDHVSEDFSMFDYHQGYLDCNLYKVKKNGVSVKALFDGHFFGFASFFLKTTMVADNETMLKMVFDVNLIT